MFFRYFGISYSKLPSTIREFLESEKCFDRAKTETTNGRNMTFDAKESTYTLQLPESSIILVDNVHKFKEMLKKLRMQNFIAFDSEWKPTFSANNEVALIQLATRDSIFLVDVVSLDIQNEDWSAFGRFVFNNDEILKIGKNVMR